MGIKDFFAKIFSAGDYNDEYAQDEYRADSPQEYELAPRFQKQTTRINKENDMANINIIEPRVYGEVEAMAAILLEHKAIIVNFRRMDKAQAARVIDYLAGIIFAVRGSVQKLSNDIFLFAPENFTIDGTIDSQDVENSRLDFVDSL